jgi:hypothetical protein
VPHPPLVLQESSLDAELTDIEMGDERTAISDEQEAIPP